VTKLENMDENIFSRGSAVAVGNFDGFHLGHEKILHTLKNIAVQKNLTSIVLTFTPNPKLYFHREPGLISTDMQKKILLEGTGVDHVYFMDFTHIVEMSNNDFLKVFLIEKLRMKHMVMGENFRFGKGRQGDISFLENAAKELDFSFTVVEPVTLDGIRISSSLIRRLLEQARIPEANRMLGRDYCIEGVVVEGEHLGQKLGFPTINVDTTNSILPEGVFQTTVQIDGQFLDSITYIGTSPTFQCHRKKVESHIFDFNRSVYGKEVRVNFQRKLRSEMSFDSKHDLVQQIKKDIQHLKFDKNSIF